MENQEEIIINNVVIDNKKKKVKKPLTDEQKLKRKEAMRNWYLKKKGDQEYVERQRLSSKTHYYKHKDQVLERMKNYQKTKLELARIEALHELQSERLIDLYTGDITQEDYDKLEQKILSKLAHIHLVS